MTEKRSWPRRLLGFFWRTLVLVYSLLFLLILVVVPAGLYMMFHEPTPPVPSKAVLVLNPDGSLVEQEPGVNDRIRSLLSNDEEPAVVRDLIMALDRARDDDRIKQVLLKLDDLDGVMPAQAQDLTRALDRFRESGKKVVAWSDSYDQSRYEWASHADEIVLDPLGQVMLTGYDSYHNYFKEGLDKLGVDVNVFRVGDYKSAVEPFTRNDMSSQSREADRVWMESLWKTYRDTIVDSRDLEVSDIDDYIDNYADSLKAEEGDAATMARHAGLVDKIAPLEAIRQKLGQKVGMNEEGSSFQQIGATAYLDNTDDQQTYPDDAGLAMVTVEGDIVDEEGVPGAVSGQTIAELINTARRDDQVAGLVLRVNSPGGSVTAAEQIRRAVQAFKKADKPVVVSMSGMAASGGYWVSMNADEIWAEPSTITGSIGIFSIVPTFSQSLDKLGIHTDGIGTTKLSGDMRLDRPLSDQAKTILQATVDHGYQEFTDRVAKARDIPDEAMDDVAQGRVWSGREAKDKGLVDHLGGVKQAEESAARQADLSESHYSIQRLLPPTDWRGLVRSTARDQVRASLLPRWLQSRVDDSVVAFLRRLDDPNMMYSRCFCNVQQSRL